MKTTKIEEKYITITEMSEIFGYANNVIKCDQNDVSIGLYSNHSNICYVLEIQYKNSLLSMPGSVMLRF